MDASDEETKAEKGIALWEMATRANCVGVSTVCKG